VFTIDLDDTNRYSDIYTFSRARLPTSKSTPCFPKEFGAKATPQGESISL
jgi:hypothetical protein